MRNQTDEQVILIVGKSDGAAEQLKELLEFMEALSVETATVDNWHARVGGRRLLAVFLGSDLNTVEGEQLVHQLGRYDPKVSIVVIGNQQHAA